MKEKFTKSSKKAKQSAQNNIFAEVHLFEEVQTGSMLNADCGCFNCDGNPCIKFHGESLPV